MKCWLCEFLSSCLRNLKIPKIWRTALVVEAKQSPRESKGLSTYIFAVYPLQDPQASYLCLCRVHHRPTSPLGASWFLTWEINCRASHFVDIGHEGEFFGKRKLVLCLLILQQPMIPYGNAALPEANASTSRQAHGQNDDVACHKLQLHTYHQERNTQHVMMPQKWHSTEISLGPPI